MRHTLLIGLATVLTALGAGCGDDAAVPPGGDPPDVGDAAPPSNDDASPPACSTVTPRPGTVVTTTGAVTGAKVGSTWIWKGIPYAAPPVGPLRFKPPAPMPCWEDERPAIDFGPMCLQKQDDGLVGAEDCLTLNVWAPEGVTNAPVLAWIHGGGNTVGTASDGLYDGQELATRTGSVVVSFQYRLGALGYFTHTSLDAEREEKVSGNYGILDQVAALRWIAANIASFGGDAKRVLLFGESAGGQNTLVHIASPLSKGLFSAAIVQSGGVYRTTLAEAEAQLTTLVERLGCNGDDVAACMRAASAESIVAVESSIGPLDRSSFRYGPVVDGWVLEEDALSVISKGAHNHVPFAIGTNADETSRMVPNVTTPEEYAAAVAAQYGPYAPSLLEQYPAADYTSPRQALIRLTTDVTWTCPARRIARAGAANQTEPVYRYYFTWRPPGAARLLVGATHGIEIPFVFRSFASFGFSSYEPSAADLSLSATMQGYWSRMGGTGDPNGAGATGWPAYVAATDPYLELGDTIAAKSGLQTEACDLIESLTQ